MNRDKQFGGPGPGNVNFRHGNSVGYTVTGTYQSWRSMIQRCTNPNRQNFRFYGGRGVKICEQWRHSFDVFLRDMGDRPKGRTLDRIDTDGNYEPGNCRWATMAEQIANRRSDYGIGPRWRDGSFRCPKRIRDRHAAQGQPEKESGR